MKLTSAKEAAMHDRLLEAVNLEDLATGAHERCAWCRAPFLIVGGHLQSFKALDGRYYCEEAHASAPYLTPRRQAS